jgi:Tat protein translocase TatB subunit
MPQIGPMEILVVSVLGLIVFGPDKLPEIARTVGAFMRQLRSMADDVKQEFSDGLDVADEPDDEELAAISEEDDGADSGESQKDVPEAEPASEESSNGRREPPPDHPVAEAIKSERDMKGSGREA